jgi:hypothetical protein
VRGIPSLALVEGKIANMGTLQNYVNPADVDDQAKDNKRVDLKYIGSLKHLKGKKGDGYYIASEDRWYFRPFGEPDEYRVRSENLNFLG